MILKKRSQRIMLTITFSVLIASVIVAIISVHYMQDRFHNYEEEIFNKLVIDSNEKDVDLFFDGITDIVNYRDIIIAVNSSGKAIDSEGLVIDEKFKEEIHRELEVEGNRIILNEDQFDLKTYVQNVNVSKDDIFTFGMDENIKVYYIPYRLVGEYDFLMNILTSLTVGCFVAAFGIFLINKDITELIKGEMING